MRSDDPDHGGERDERLDLPVVGRREVARVEREQEDGEDPRDEPAEAVDRRVLAEPAEFRRRDRPSEASVEASRRSATRSRSWTCSTYARDVGADPAALGGVGDERLEAARAGCPSSRCTIGTCDAERLLGPRDRLVVQEGDDGLAERHALDREQPVPARVELVDDDVGLAVALERLVVVQALDEDEVDVEALAGRDHVLGALAAPRGGRVEDRPGARGRDGGAGSIARTSIPGGITSASGTQRIASYEPTTSAPAFFPNASSPGDFRGCPSRGSA